MLQQEEEFKQQQASGQALKKPGKKNAQQQGKMIEEVLNRPESQEIKAIGMQIRQWQKDNNEEGVSNEQAVELFLTKIKQSFTQQKQEEIIEAYKQAKETFEQRLLEKEKVKEQEDLKKKKGTKTQLSKKQLIQQQQQQQQQLEESKQPTDEELLQAISENKTFYLVNGFSLTNYPSTLNQAKALEQSITGYIMPEERINVHAEQKKKQLELLVKKSAIEEYLPVFLLKNIIFSQLQQGMFDLLLVVNLDVTECVRRFQNRKIDPITQTIYHMTDNPPPENDKKVLDRLQPYEEPGINLDTIAKSHILMNEEKQQIANFYKNFGHEGDKIPMFVELNLNDKSKLEILELFDAEINKILAMKQKQLEEELQAKLNIIHTQYIQKCGEESLKLEYLTIALIKNIIYG